MKRREIRQQVTSGHEARQDFALFNPGDVN